MPGAVSTTRSQFRPAARSTSWLTLSPAMPPTTAMRSRLAPEHSCTMVFSACCTVRSVLSHTTTATSSSAAARAKAAS